MAFETIRKSSAPEMVAVTGGPYGTVPVAGFEPHRPALSSDVIIDLTAITD